MRWSQSARGCLAKAPRRPTRCRKASMCTTSRSSTAARRSPHPLRRTQATSTTSTAWTRQRAARGRQCRPDPCRWCRWSALRMTGWWTTTGGAPPSTARTPTTRTTTATTTPTTRTTAPAAAAATTPRALRCAGAGARAAANPTTTATPAATRATGGSNSLGRPSGDSAGCVCTSDTPALGYNQGDLRSLTNIQPVMNVLAPS
mmetsp:Transcript_20291/g.51935  ORF Transcript_20291/g.51935 Transcript_20291/m.51935 type:complete len:203 (-) Transcript_20291:60-668(-)